MTGYVGTRREGGNDVILLTNSRREGSEYPLTPITIGVAYVPTGEGGAQSRAIVGAEVGLLNTDYLMSFGEKFYNMDYILSTDMAGGRVSILRETITVL